MTTPESSIQPPSFPAGIRAAGWLWIASGVILLLIPVSMTVWVITKNILNPLPGPSLLVGLLTDGWVILWCPMGIAALVLSAATRVGLGYIRGDHDGTLWYGILALVIGLPIAPTSGIGFSWSLPEVLAGRQDLLAMFRLLIFTGLLLMSLGLVAAGTLLLWNRKAYLAWKQRPHRRAELPDSEP